LGNGLRKFSGPTGLEQLLTVLSSLSSANQGIYFSLAKFLIPPVIENSKNVFEWKREPATFS
jgi:hypothetical protein